MWNKKAELILGNLDNALNALRHCKTARDAKDCVDVMREAIEQLKDIALTPQAPASMPQHTPQAGIPNK